MSLADEFRPILDQYFAKRIGGEGPVGIGDAVEPRLANAVPLSFRRNAAIDAAEAQSAQSGKLANDLCVTSGPMREEFVWGKFRPAADEADAPDHDQSFPYARDGGWNSSRVIPSWIRR